jgi:hypothetical protein
VEEVPEPPSGLSVGLAGPGGFYAIFRRAHGLQQLPQAPVPEIAIASGTSLQIPLSLRNNSATAKELTLSLSAPEGWVTLSGNGSYTLRAGEQLPVLVTLDSPKTVEGKVDEIVCRAQADGQTIGTIKLHVRRRSGGLPQN